MKLADCETLITTLNLWKKREKLEKVPPAVKWLCHEYKAVKIEWWAKWTGCGGIYGRPTILRPNNT